MRAKNESAMSWKTVCKATEFPENGLKQFDVDGTAILLANLDGDYFAYPPFCPHMEERLETSGLCEGGMLTCTKHLWQWNMRTGEKTGPAEKDLLMYEIKREGDDILINLEKELEYEYEEEDDEDDDSFWD